MADKAPDTDKFLPYRDAIYSMKMDKSYGDIKDLAAEHNLDPDILELVYWSFKAGSDYMQNIYLNNANGR